MRLKRFKAVEADLIRAGAGETSANAIGVTVAEPHASSPTSAGVNAFECLLRHGQAAHRRTPFISQSDLFWLAECQHCTGVI